MSLSSPKVSICIPVYNCAAFIDRTIQSVLAQTFVDFELIIVDNHSSDDSRIIIADYEKRDARIQIYYNEHTVNMEGNWNRTVARREVNISSCCQQMT